MPPCLSPRETELLASFLTLHFNLTALAQKHTLSAPELLAFAHSPAVTAALAGLRRFRHLADHLAHADERREACAKLVHLLRTSTDAIEQRKAAACLLRNTTPPPQIHAARARSTPRSPLDAPYPPARPEPQTPDSEPDPSLPRSLDPSIPRSPDPSRHPELLLAHLARAFNPLTGDAGVAVSHLKDALAPDAVINGRTPPKDLQGFRRLLGTRDDEPLRRGPHYLDRAPLAPFKEALALVPGDPYATEMSFQQNFIAVHADGDTDHIHLRLAQLKPGRWRIASITTRRGAQRPAPAHPARRTSTPGSPAPPSDRDGDTS